MKTYLAVLIAAALLSLPARSKTPEPLFATPLSPRIASYEIRVTLDPATRLLHGREVVRWRNAGGAGVGELWFHLYQNAFRNDRSSYMREGAEAGGLKVKKDGWGFVEVESIRLAGGPDLKPSLEYLHPDDDNADDRTVMRVKLPSPVAPGMTVEVEIEFVERLPEPPQARSGSKGDYFFVSQWFPKLGVLEPGGWNCHQYHLHTEFFADFGVYDVWISAPAKEVVGATGTLVERTAADGLATHYFHAEDVHDFAWTASPRFKEFTGRSEDVDIRVLMQPEHADQGPRHVAAAGLAVKYFQDWYGDYPYPNLTVVDPARGAVETGGMEYPTLITAGTLVGLPAGVRAPEMVIIHEFGHNFWYHLVASNEFEDAWLDEGINTYSEIQILRDLYGKASFVDLPGLKLDDLQVRRYSYIQDPDEDPIVRDAWKYYSGGSYRANAYSKPALALVTLENYLGHETMIAIMRAYFERWKFRHPETKDFVAVANETAGQNLDWYFDQVLYSNATLDYTVAGIDSREVKPGKGYDYTLACPECAAPAPAAEGPKMYLSEVKVRRLGDFHFPVKLLVTFADGSSVREEWDGVDTWKKFYYLRPVKLASAKVDPDDLIPLDLDTRNNCKTMTSESFKHPQAPYYLEMLRFLLRPSGN